MSSKVFYKLKSCKQFESINYEGSSITLKQVKQAIQKKYGIKSCSFDLKIEAQNGQVFTEDEQLIPSGTHLIATRQLNPFNTSGADKSKRCVPTTACSMPAAAPMMSLNVPQAFPTSHDSSVVLSKPKFEAQIEPIQISQPGDTSECMKDASTHKEEPEIQETNVGVSVTQEPVAPEDIRLHDVTTDPKESDARCPPNELTCPLCRGLLHDAMFVNCCGATYCNACLQLYVFPSASSSWTCPNCSQLLADRNRSVAENTMVRQMVRLFLETGSLQQPLTAQPVLFNHAPLTLNESQSSSSSGQMISTLLTPKDTSATASSSAISSDPEPAAAKKRSLMSPTNSHRGPLQLSDDIEEDFDPFAPTEELEDSSYEDLQQAQPSHPSATSTVIEPQTISSNPMPLRHETTLKNDNTLQKELPGASLASLGFPAGHAMSRGAFPTPQQTNPMLGMGVPLPEAMVDPTLNIISSLAVHGGVPFPPPPMNVAAPPPFGMPPEAGGNNATATAMFLAAIGGSQPGGPLLGGNMFHQPVPTAAPPMALWHSVISNSGFIPSHNVDAFMAWLSQQQNPFPSPHLYREAFYNGGSVSLEARNTSSSTAAAHPAPTSAKSSVASSEDVPTPVSSNEVNVNEEGKKIATKEKHTKDKPADASQRHKNRQSPGSSPSPPPKVSPRKEERKTAIAATAPPMSKKLTDGDTSMSALNMHQCPFDPILYFKFVEILLKEGNTTVGDVLTASKEAVSGVKSHSLQQRSFAATRKPLFSSTLKRGAFPQMHRGTERSNHLRLAKLLSEQAKRRLAMRKRSPPLQGRREIAPLAQPHLKERTSSVTKADSNSRPSKNTISPRSERRATLFKKWAHQASLRDLRWKMNNSSSRSSRPTQHQEPQSRSSSSSPSSFKRMIPPPSAAFRLQRRGVRQASSTRRSRSRSDHDTKRASLSQFRRRPVSSYRPPSSPPRGGRNVEGRRTRETVRDKGNWRSVSNRSPKRQRRR